MDRRELLQLSLAASTGLHMPLAEVHDKPTPDEMIHAYLKAEVERISKKFMDGAKTKAEWEQIRPELKRQFLDMAGLDPLPEKTPLKATITGTLERGDVAIENVHFQSIPGLYVTGNVYRPKRDPKLVQGSGKRYPTILYVCGHSGRGRDGNKTAFADHGFWFASNGYVCLVIDTLQLGEVAGKHHGTYNLDRFWWHSRGYTPAGVECWNGIRAIDYLCTRPEVDPEKIGVTGISGGGATTCWIAAADDRVKVAVPVSGMSDLESYVTNKVINGHCDCMFIHNAYQWEWTTILALFAPKPLLFANSDNDNIFPMDGNRRIIARLRQCYDMLGAKDHVDEYVSKGGHDYRPDLRLAIFGFFHKHLKGDNGKIEDSIDPKIPGKDLRVFPTDADLPKDSINATVDEVFVPKAEVKLPEAKDFKDWKTGMVKKLREKVFLALPNEVPAPIVKLDEDTLNFFIEPEPGVVIHFQDVYSNLKAKGNEALLFLNPDEKPKDAGRVWSERSADSFKIAAVHLRGCGPTKWTRTNPPNTIERSLPLLGQTVDSGRIRDVLSMSPVWLPVDEKAPPIRLLGSSATGVIAAFAILLRGGVWEIIIADPPTSHRDGPHFLNVMRVLDIPEALGLLAPDVKLTLIGKNAKDKAFDKTAEIYKLAGAAEKFKRE